MPIQATQKTRLSKPVAGPKLVDKGFKQLAARRVPQAAERSFLDLTNAFARDAQQVAYLVQGEGFLAVETEIARDDIALAIVKAVEHHVDMGLDRFGQQLFVG